MPKLKNDTRNDLSHKFLFALYRESIVIFPNFLRFFPATFSLRDRAQDWSDLHDYRAGHVSSPPGPGRLRPRGGHQHLGHRHKQQQSHNQTH